jgi:hypothetical protein
MRKPRKLTNPESEMTRLKLLWKKSLLEAERDYWREQFASARSHPVKAGNTQSHRKIFRGPVRGAS